MKGGTTFFCPSCHHRQVVGKAGETLNLPVAVKCEQCGTQLTLDKSKSGGVHVSVAGGPTPA